MNLLHLQSPIKAIVFDAYGTLVEITERRAPFRQLMQWMATERMPQVDDAARLMSNPVSLAGAATMFGVSPPLALLSQLETDLHTELSSIQAFTDTAETLRKLHQHGLKLGLCSNLAMPYAVPTQFLIPKLDAYIWSFEARAIKPDPAIYSVVCQQLQCDPAEVLFIGDTPEADYLGPKQFGMQALLLNRGMRKEHDLYPQISSLLELVS